MTEPDATPIPPVYDNDPVYPAHNSPNAAVPPEPPHPPYRQSGFAFAAPPQPGFSPAMPPQPGFSPIAAPAPKQPWSTGKTVGIIIAIVLACALVLGAGGCTLLSLLTSSPAAVGRPTVNNPLSGYNWRASDGSYLMLADNGTFIWYESERDQTDMFYSGRYAVYFGEDAVEHVTGDLASYGVTRSELDQLFARSDETMSVDSFCCLVLDNQQLVVDGENTLKEPTLTPCYGFYYEDEEFLDVANMNTGSYWAFTKA